MYGINKLAKYSHTPGEKNFLALIHLLIYLSQHTQYGLTFYSNIEDVPVYKMLKVNKVTPSRKLFTFTDSSWDDDFDTSRSKQGYLIFNRGGLVDHFSNMTKISEEMYES